MEKNYHAINDLINKDGEVLYCLDQEFLNKKSLIGGLFSNYDKII